MLDVDPLLIPEKLLDPRVLDADAPFDPAVTLEPWVLDMDTLLKLPVFWDPWKLFTAVPDVPLVPCTFEAVILTAPCASDTEAPLEPTVPLEA